MYHLAYANSLMFQVLDIYIGELQNKRATVWKMRSTLLTDGSFK